MNWVIAPEIALPVIGTVIINSLFIYVVVLVYKIGNRKH